MTFVKKAFLTSSLALATTLAIAGGGEPTPPPPAAETSVPPGGRDFNFFVTADPQYDNANHTRNAVSTRTLKAIGQNFGSNSKNRGLLVAGDLTQNTRPVDEFKFYTDAIANFSGYVFDGQGNHDDHDAIWYQTLACPLISSCVDEGRLINDIRNRSRTTPINLNSEGTVYSWDWHGVHFIQLGTYPADSAYTGGWASHVNPRKSLSFLKNDLRDRVGTSGRPVVLIFHYEMQNDAGDGAAWSHDQIREFWNAMGNYNVKAIFGGHIHYGQGGGWYRTAYRPGGATAGPASVPNIIAGGAVNGMYIRAQVRGDNMEIKRFYVDGNNNSSQRGSTYNISLR